MAEAELISRAGGLAWVDSGDRVVVLRLDDLTAGPVVLDGTAASLWLLLDAPRAVDQLARDAAEIYGVPAVAVLDDVLAWVADCYARELLTPAS